MLLSFLFMLVGSKRRVCYSSGACLLVTVSTGGLGWDCEAWYMEVPLVFYRHVIALSPAGGRLKAR